MTTVRESKQRASIRNRSLRLDQRRFRVFLWFVATIAVLLLGIIVAVQRAHTPPAKPLISPTWDDVLGTVLTTVLATVVASSLVGILIDEYQRRFGERVKNFDEFVEREGILAVYASSNEPDLLTALSDAISDARAEIIGVGLGLSILMNRMLLMRIAERLNTERSLTVSVLLGSEQNVGVMNRLAEEKNWHDKNKLAYDDKWIVFFPNEIRSILELYAGPAAKDRISVRQISSYPTVGVLKIDNKTFFFLYGAPSMRGGSQSPWIALDARETSGVLNQFVSRYLDHFVAEADVSLKAAHPAPGVTASPAVIPDAPASGGP